MPTKIDSSSSLVFVVTGTDGYDGFWTVAVLDQGVDQVVAFVDNLNRISKEGDAECKKVPDKIQDGFQCPSTDYEGTFPIVDKYKAQLVAAGDLNCYCGVNDWPRYSAREIPYVSDTPSGSSDPPATDPDMPPAGHVQPQYG